MISTMVTTLVVGTIFMCGLILVFVCSPYRLCFLYVYIYRITVTTKLALVLLWLLVFLVQ